MYENVNHHDIRTDCELNIESFLIEEPCDNIDCEIVQNESTLERSRLFNLFNKNIYRRWRSPEVAIKLIRLVLLLVCWIISSIIGESSVQAISSRIFLDIVYGLYSIMTVLSLFYIIFEEKLNESTALLINISGGILVGASGGVAGYVGIAKSRIELYVLSLSSFAIGFIFVMEVSNDMNTLTSLRF